MPEYGQYDVPKSDVMVNLGVGQPDNRKLPLDIIKDAMRNFIDTETNPEVLQYGNIPGYNRFRNKLADWLTKKSYVNIPDTHKKFDYKINENELFITNGVTSALHFIMTCFMNQDDTIFVEDPTYFIIINIFKDFGLNVIPIKMEDDGLDLDELEENVEQVYLTQNYVFLYTIPINHNPTGITMSHKKRIILSKLCKKYDNFRVLADEVYHFLSWNETDKVLPLADYHPNILTIGSFSKILAPSLRLGWIYQNKKVKSDNILMDKLIESGLYDSTGGSAVLSSYITEVLIDNGKLDEYIEECKDFLGKRCKVICDELLPLKEDKLVDYKVPNGGYFVWVKLDDIKANYLLEKSIPNKVKFHQGWKFTSNKKDFSDHMRISVSFYDEEDLKIGIGRLRETIYNIDKISVSILGATGRLGSLVVEEVKKNNDLFYNGPITRDFNLSHLSNNNNVIIDVSLPEATNKLLEKLLETDLTLPLIIGTTGEIDDELLNNYANIAPVVRISNFSDGIPAIFEMTKYLNNLPESWKFNMIETHHVNKKDSPSGTAKSWKNIIKRDCSIESLREEDVFGEHKLVLSNDSEEIVIHHTAKNRNIFASGCIKYIDWILEKEPGLYDKMDLSEYKESRVKKYSASGNILIVAEFIKEKKWKKFVLSQAKSDEKLDGVIFIEKLETETKWTYFNRDGNIASFCGNGVRCIGKYLSDYYKELTGTIKNVSIQTKYQISENNIYFNAPKVLPVRSASHISKISELTNQYEFLNVIDVAIYIVGVPHIIILCNCDIFKIDENIIDYLSKSIHESFNNKFNINFINISNNDFQIRTFERGVNRETGACGSGSLASFYFLYEKGDINRSCKVHFKNSEIMNLYTDDSNFYLGGKVEDI